MVLDQIKGSSYIFIEYFLALLEILIFPVMFLKALIIKQLIILKILPHSKLFDDSQIISELIKCRKFTKLPKHLGISCVEGFRQSIDNEITLKEVAKIISWAWVADIKCISLNDSLKDFENNQALFEYYLKKAFYKASVYLRENEIGLWKGVPSFQIQSHTHQPLTKEGIKMHEDNNVIITTYSNENCIVSGIKDLIEIKSKPHDAPSKAATFKIIDVKTLGLTINKLNDENNVVTKLKTMTPDLMMLFGDTKSTLGFNSWNLLFTEIHWLPNLHQSTFEDFFYSLQKYNNCEQRLGK